MTATEWLFEQINNTLIDYTEGRISALVYGVRLTEFKYKAKEMEREQQERVVNMALLNTTSSQTEISDEEIAIKFAEWCRDNAVSEVIYGELEKTNNWELRSHQKVVTTKELFQIFLNGIENN